MRIWIGCDNVCWVFLISPIQWALPSDVDEARYLVDARKYKNKKIKVATELNRDVSENWEAFQLRRADNNNITMRSNEIIEIWSHSFVFRTVHSTGENVMENWVRKEILILPGSDEYLGSELLKFLPGRPTCSLHFQESFLYVCYSWRKSIDIRFRIHIFFNLPTRSQME